MKKFKRYVFHTYKSGAITGVNKLTGTEYTPSINTSSGVQNLPHVVFGLHYYNTDEKPKFHVIWHQTVISRQEITNVLLWLADVKNWRWFERQLAIKHITNVSFDDVKQALIT
jgi:hypothetical protein